MNTHTYTQSAHIHKVKKNKPFILCVYEVCVCTCKCAPPHKCAGQRKTCGNQFTPLTMWAWRSNSGQQNC